MTLDFDCQLDPQPIREKTPRRALVVEDDAGQREVLEHRLRSQGFVVDAAATGGEGLALARRRRPDVALVDLRLPDMDGFEVCEQLADDPGTCDVPALMITAAERPDIVRRARAAGCQYFVRKPYDPNALLVLIETALREADQWPLE